ncbi:MAG: CARDB domain-containing protein [Anaerolineae bacterium]
MTARTVNKQSKRRLFAQSGFVIRVLLLIAALSLALLSSACDPEEDIPGLAQAPKAALPPPPAAPQDAGPQAWLEYPLEGQTMSLEEPVPFVVYASDAQGVAQVELRVNGEPLPAAQVEGLSPDGSSRLVRLDQDWQPAAEGEYIVEARGRNTAGGYGEPAYVKFCVGSCQPVTVTPSPAPQQVITPAPAAQYDLYVRRMDFMQTNPMVGETIELFVMVATDTYPSQAPFFPASHFRWRQGPGFAWQEESCPDDTHYASCAKTVTFSYTQAGSYYVEVEADSLGEVAEADETNNVSGWTITVGTAHTPTPTPTGAQPPTPTYTATPYRPTATPTPTPPPPSEVVINFWSDAPYVNAGQCTTLHWDVKEVREVYLNGGPVAGQGDQQVCLCEAATYTLHVVKLDGSTEDRQVFIDVYGSCETPEPPPPQDTTGPDISWVGLAWEDCQFYGQATINDGSGVSWAQFRYSINGEGPYSVWMQDIGGGLWQTEVPISADTGMGTPAGTIQYHAVASDGLGNESTSYSGSEDFMCGGYEL